ncbi:MAG TPA: FG-GAP repeat protein [Gammaproteobacteria bacterium]
MRRLFKMLAVALLASALFACGDVENGEAGTGGFTLTAAVSGIKTITFSWTSYPGATYYRLFVNPDGSSGYQQVGGDVTSTNSEVQLPVHLIDWVNARYLVEAYDAGGMIASSPAIDITSLMLDAIGYAKASNTGLDDQFGYRVALSGDGNTVAISAIGEDSSATGINGEQADELATDAGAVYLFVRSIDSWVQQAYIKASNTDPFDAFGSSLALSSDGNTLAVGASGESSGATGVNGEQTLNTAAQSGAVYLFTRNASTWSQQAYLKASNTDANDNFGSSVALSSDGNTLAVGATGEDSAATGINGDEDSDTASNSGAVYLFTRSATSWTQQAYLKASNTEAFDAFGGSLTLSSDGNSLAVGAVGEDSAATGINGDELSDAAIGSGAVYLFARSSGVWSQQAYVKASNTGAGDAFGSSVALSGDGDTLAVGASLEDSSAVGVNGDQLNELAVNAGAVYLFTRSADLWSQQTYLKATNTDPFDNFGVAVALNNDGSVLAVGADQEDSGALGINGDPFDNSATDAGALYLYTRTAGVWSNRSYVKAPNTEVLDHFGASITLNGDGHTLVIGATGEDSNASGIGGDMSNNDLGSAGAAYLY